MARWRTWDSDLAPWLEFGPPSIILTRMASAGGKIGEKEGVQCQIIEAHCCHLHFCWA